MVHFKKEKKRKNYLRLVVGATSQYQVLRNTQKLSLWIVACATFIILYDYMYNHYNIIFSINVHYFCLFYNFNNYWKR